MGSLHSSCCRVCPSMCSTWPSTSLVVALTKEVFPHFYYKTEKYGLSISGENVTLLKFLAFLSSLCSVLGRD